MGGREAMWAQRRELISRWEQSGLSMAEFCRREGLAYWKFLSWRNRLAQMDGSGGGFAELVVSGEQCASEDGQLGQAAHRALAEIVLPGGAFVRVFAGADAALLRDAVQAARAC
jgi:hypothetical protein